MSLLVLQRSPYVGLGALAEALEARDIDVVVVDPSTTTSVDLDGVTGVLALGGEAEDGMLDGEVDLLRRAVEAELPTFGICFGAATLAVAVGGQVAERERPEVGFIPLSRTAVGAEDDVAAGWPDGAVMFAIHQHEVAGLPAEASQLLIGSDGPSLWRLGSAYGCALHPEADADTIGVWLESDVAAATVAAAGLDLEELRAENERRARFSRSAGLPLLLRWVDGLLS